MKKLLACLLILSLLLVSCGGTVSPDDATNNHKDVPPSPPVDNDDDDTDDTTTPDDDDVPLPTLPEDAVNACTDWGVSTDPGAGIANGVLLYEKMTALKNGATVFFPEGTYELDLPLLLSGKKNIRVVGHKAIFLNTRATNTTASQAASDDARIPESLRASTATSGMVWIEGSQNITVEGITFRYLTPTSLSGKVINKTSSYIDVEITDGSAITGDECVMAINTFTQDGVPDRVLEQYTTFSVEKRNDTTLRVYGGNVSSLGTGVYVCLRTSLSSNYIFTIFNSSDLTFRNLTLNNSLNGGFLIEHRTVNATFDGVRVASHNPHALMSLNADALHIAGLGGTLTVKDCHFERAGDDFINVHAVAAKPTAVTATGLTYTLSWGGDSRWAAKGDVIEFFDPTTFATLGTATITQALGTTLTFDRLPDGVTTDTVLSNKTLHPAVRITNTYASNNRARAFLLQTDDVVITDCTFSDTALAAILIAPDIDNWMEVSPARGVTISNSSFTNCGTYAAGVIQITADHDDPTRVYPTMIHSDITISGCTFAASAPALYAVNCVRLTFTVNTTAAVTATYILDIRSSDTVTYDGVPASQVKKTNVTNVTAQ